MANDILILGTGYFAEIMICDLASTAQAPLHVLVGGRNVERMTWLAEAGRSRAAIFGTPVTFGTLKVDSGSPESIGEALAKTNPRIVVQSASLQSPWKVDRMDSEWSRLVAEAGFGMTIAFHSVLPSRTAKAVKAAGANVTFVNTCYPDGVNQVLHRAGLPITTGVGNIAIYAAVIAGLLPAEQRGSLRVLGHHQHLVQWRKPGMERAGAAVRAWVGENELPNVDDMTRHVQLPYRDLNAISGASAVPVLRALAGHGDILAHVPGPGGLPGGYPVRVSAGCVTLDLPKGLTRDAAIAWNRGFEDADGVSISDDGRVTYSERARDALAAYSPTLAAGFNVVDVEAVARELGELRARLGG